MPDEKDFALDLKKIVEEFWMKALFLFLFFKFFIENSVFKSLKIY